VGVPEWCVCVAGAVGDEAPERTTPTTPTGPPPDVVARQSG
jgi:hypothetical protein